MKRVTLLIILLLAINLTLAGDSDEKTGWGWGGVPAVNYNADEGFGYGVVGNIYNYADGGYEPYYWTVQPQIFFTTGGKQEHWLWFDSPYILGNGIRITAELKYLKQLFLPYYGIGNDSEYDEDFFTEDAAGFLDEYWYKYERQRISMKADFQKALKTHENGRPKLSALVGFGVINTSNATIGETSLLACDVDSGIVTQEEIDGGFTNYIKMGVVHDTRDNEPAPNRGHWTDLVVETYPGFLGSDFKFTRLTATDRRYFPIGKKLVYAQRIVVEKCFGDIPFFDMPFYGSSFKVEEGLGGSKSLRGVLKNRYLGESKAFANLEIRYKFLEFKAAGQNFYLATNEFVDFGKVWSDDDEAGLSDIHVGYGAGLHIGWNENFIIAVDGATSEETGLQLYIGLGYLF